MRQTRIETDDKNQNTRGEIIGKMEDLAIDYYNQTGHLINMVKFAWTFDEVPEEHLMNDLGHEEQDVQVKAIETRFT